MKNPDLYLPMLTEEDDVDLIAKLRRDARKIDARLFRGKYIYGRSTDKKTCISSGGNYSWSDNSSGVTWVGVHGNDSICVVTKAGYLDVTRVHGWLIFLSKEEVLRRFRNTVISEIEDIADPSSKLRERLVQSIKEPFGADPSSELRERLVQSIKEPFGAVSVEGGHERGHESSSDDYKEDKIFKLFLEELNSQVPSDEYVIDENDVDSIIRFKLKRDIEERRSLPEGAWYDEKNTIKILQEEMERDAAITIDATVQETSDEETSDKCDEKKAVKFLEEKMKTVVDFTLEETIQVAISAFQHLFGRKFNADDIGVSVLDPKDPVNKDIYVKELEKSEIKYHLAEINSPGSGGSSSSDSTITNEGSD